VGGAASTQQSLFISNAGISDITFTKFAIEGPGAERFAMDGTAPNQINQGQTLEIKFAFTANALGDVGAVLTVDTSEKTNVSVVLKGLGKDLLYELWNRTEFSRTICDHWNHL